MSVKIQIPQNHRKALKDFVQNPVVAARMVVGEFDHLLPQEVKDDLKKTRETDPGIILIAKDRIERAVKAGQLSPAFLAKNPDPISPERRKQIKEETAANKAANRAKYGK